MPPSTWIDSDKRQNVGVDVAAIVNHRALRGGGATHRLAVEEAKRDGRVQSARKTELPGEVFGGVVEAGRLPCCLQNLAGDSRVCNGSPISIRGVIGQA